MYYKINKKKNIFIYFFILKHDFILHGACAVGIPILLSDYGIIYFRRVTNRRWGPWGLWGLWVLVGSMGIMGSVGSDGVHGEGAGRSARYRPQSPH